MCFLGAHESEPVCHEIEPEREQNGSCNTQTVLMELTSSMFVVILGSSYLSGASASIQYDIFNKAELVWIYVTIS